MMEQGKDATIQFVKKMNLSGAEVEACEQCAAESICKLQELLRKVKIPKHETLIVSCGLRIE